MKNIVCGLVVLLMMPLQTLQAAYRCMPVKTREVIIEDGVKRYKVSHPSYSFRVEVISDDEGIKTETLRRGHSFVTARPEERYAVRLYNPLPVQVAVNLTVDGLNSITGKPSSIKDGTKWLIAPYSFVTIRGWQVDGNEARRFFFTDKPKSYAEWRGDMLGKDLAANCGVIGAAYFWNQKELDAYYESHPQYLYTQTWAFNGAPQKKSSPPEPIATASLDAAKAQEAGTGMGERESHPTELVDFDYDTGMYRLSQAVVIYYDFAQVPTPNPFPALSYAPEMP